MLSLVLAALAAMLVVLSLAGFLLAALDRRRRARGAQPLPAGPQLLLALAGGWPGLGLGRALFGPAPRDAEVRHVLALATVVNLALAGGGVAAAWVLDGGDPRALAADLSARALALAGGPADGGAPEEPQLPRRFGPGS